MIKLPHYNWFFQMQGKYPITNTYTGSSGTEGRTGCFAITTFNYTVFVNTKVKTDEDGKQLEPYTFVAEWYYIYPFGHTPQRSEVTRCIFENSPEGLAQLTEWLSEAEMLEP